MDPSCRPGELDVLVSHTPVTSSLLEPQRGLLASGLGTFTERTTKEYGPIQTPHGSSAHDLQSTNPYLRTSLPGTPQGSGQRSPGRDLVDITRLVTKPGFQSPGAPRVAGRTLSPTTCTAQTLQCLLARIHRHISVLSLNCSLKGNSRPSTQACHTARWHKQLGGGRNMWMDASLRKASEA